MPCHQKVLRPHLLHGLLCLALASLPALARAGDADNIFACAQAAHDYAGLTLDPHEASYRGRILAFSEANWPAQEVACEVKLGLVYNLRVGARHAVREGYAGDEAWQLAGQLDSATDEAIGLLRARIELLKKARDDAQAALREPGRELGAIQRSWQRERDRALAATPVPARTPARSEI